MVPFEMKTLYQPKHPEVLRINPKRQVPVLIDGDVEIFDSTQIFEYFESIKPEPALWPTEPPARARARLLEHKSDEVYFRRSATDGHEGPRRPRAVEARPPRALLAAWRRAMGERIAGRQLFIRDIAFYMAQISAMDGAP